MHENSSPGYDWPGDFSLLGTLELSIPWLVPICSFCLHTCQFSCTSCPSVLLDFSQADTVGGRENDGDRKKERKGGRKKPKNLRNYT